MKSWSDILKEFQETESQYDYIRRRYLKELSKFTGRNTIAYYSAWLTKQGIPNSDITDVDMTGFMNCMQGINCSKGLDLILHTPGGSPAAAEAIVSYLRRMFNNDLRVVVPQLAMSAGTMICCAAKEIVMGKQSSLGPIDPQFNGIPAYSIKKEFEDAQKDLLVNPKNAQYWAIKLQQYPAAFMNIAIDAIALSSELVSEWLGTCMFDKNDPNQKNIIDNIVDNLNEHSDSKIHDRHFDSDLCKSFGLKIRMLEDDSELQDRVLSLHHAYMITLENTPAIKIIECQNNQSRIQNIRTVR